MQEARIENWLHIAGVLYGNVYGHPRFEDGTAVVTSTVQSLDTEKKIAVTRNTTYTLGAPRPEPAQ